MAQVLAGKTISIAVKAGNVIKINEGGIGYIDVNGNRTPITGGQQDVAIAKDGTALLTLISGACSYWVKTVSSQYLNFSIDSNTGKISNATNPDGTASTFGRNRKAGIFASREKPITNRSGWPYGRLTGQAIATVYIKNIGKDTDAFRLSYVGAYSYQALDASGGTVQAKIKHPTTGSWIPVTFNSAVAGTVPNTGLKELVSDVINIPFKAGTELKMINSGLSVIACTTGGDWMSPSNSVRETFAQIASTNPQAMQLEFANDAQLDALSMNPATRFVTATSYVTTQIQFNIPGHGVASATNRRAICTGFDNSACNGTFSFVLNGSDAIRITMADPGVINQRGVVSFGFAPTSFSWSGGYLTVNLTAHGRTPGEYLTFSGYATTGVALNGNREIFDTPTADSFRIAMADPGSINATNGCYLLTYTNSSATQSQYHFRPLAVIAEHSIECTLLFSDSTSSVIDVITDNSMVSGVAERCVGRDIPFLNLSAGNDSLNQWVTNRLGNHAIQWGLADKYCDTVTFGMQKNDEGLYNVASFPSWKAVYDELWTYEPFSRFAATGQNKAILAPSGKTASRDEYTTVEGQTANDGALRLFHQLLLSDFGTKYNYVFRYAEQLYEYNLPGIYKVDPGARDVIVTSVAGSSLVTFDASTPISVLDNMKTLAIPGGGSGGTGYAYGQIRYRSPTSAVLVSAFSPRRPVTVENAVSSVTCKIGARLMISNSTSVGVATIHESPYAMQQITPISFTNPFGN